MESPYAYPHDLQSESYVENQYIGIIWENKAGQNPLHPNCKKYLKYQKCMASSQVHTTEFNFLQEFRYINLVLLVQNKPSSEGHLCTIIETSTRFYKSAISSTHICITTVMSIPAKKLFACTQVLQSYPTRCKTQTYSNILSFGIYMQHKDTLRSTH